MACVHQELAPSGGARASSARAPGPVCDALPPGRDTFILEISVMPPLPKICPKTVSAPEGGSLSAERAFAKKFSGVGEDSAVVASAGTSTYGSAATGRGGARAGALPASGQPPANLSGTPIQNRSEEHTSELQSLRHLVC